MKGLTTEMITKNETSKHLEHGDVDALTSARADLMPHTRTAQCAWNMAQELAKRWNAAPSL